MNKIRAYKKNKNMRGFTLAETVVAMTIILFVCVATITAIVYCVSISKRNDSKLFFVVEVDNYLQCYIKDGLIMDNNSMLAFHFGGATDSYVEKKVDNSGFRVYYDNKYRIMNKTDSAKASFYVDVILVKTGGVFVKACAKTNDNIVYQMKNTFLRASDYAQKGGNV